MVSFVIVSHSAPLAEGVVDLARMMARQVTMIPAGGLEDGSHGTSFEKIAAAVEAAWTEDGVILLMDMGSAVMTAEMVLEALDKPSMVMADCPLVEGAVTGSVLAESGAGLDEIMEELKTVAQQKKLS